MNTRQLTKLITERLAWGRTLGTKRNDGLNTEECQKLLASIDRLHTLAQIAQSFDQKNETTDEFGAALRALEANGELAPLPVDEEPEPALPSTAARRWLGVDRPLADG